MLEGVHIFCFAASYTVALALEISRFLFRSGIRGAVMLGFAAAGLVAHTAYLYHRAVGMSGAPLSSSQDWYLLAAWALVVVYLFLVAYYPRAGFGVFLLPLILGLIAAATFFADPQPFAREPASMVWGKIHGTAVLLATVSVLLGFAAGLMYLGQAWRLKHKRTPRGGLRLPSLEWLQRANSRALLIAAVMLAAGVASGVVLNLINYRHRPAGLPWTDPVILSTGVMFLWLVTVVLLGALYRPTRQGRKVAYLTLAAFVFLLLALATVTGLVGSTQHGGGKTAWQIENGRLEIANRRGRERSLECGDSSPLSVRFPREVGTYDARGEDNREQRRGIILVGGKYDASSLFRRSRQGYRCLVPASLPGVIEFLASPAKTCLRPLRTSQSAICNLQFAICNPPPPGGAA